MMGQGFEQRRRQRYLSESAYVGTMRLFANDQVQFADSLGGAESDPKRIAVP